ncbi:hypothetical protein TNCV_4678151 [Trichonephila clavipes]|nr:hypothetical protein TNCV_4678151 [Trichonephila clavipes]
MNVTLGFVTLIRLFSSLVENRARKRCIDSWRYCMQNLFLKMHRQNLRSKSRVALANSITIPCLELHACVLQPQLLEKLPSAAYTTDNVVDRL